MDELINQIKQQANLENVRKSYIQPCIITNYDYKNYRVKVQLVPEETVTGWLPLASWGEIIPPKIGTQALVVFPGGNINGGIVIGKIFSDQDPPPQDDDVTHPGSFLFKTRNGTIIKVTDAGQIVIEAVDGQSVTINSTENVFVGNSAEDFKRLVKETLKDLYNGHTHPSNGAPPDVIHRMTDADLTSVLEGN